MWNKSNAVLKILSVFICLIIISEDGNAQNVLPREYVSDSTRISLVKELPFDFALKAINDIRQRLQMIPIIDLTQRKNPIGVDIVNKTITQAFDEILRANNLTYIETEAFIQIVGVEAGGIPGQPVTEIGGTATETILAQKPIDSGLHEVRISATFFIADRGKFKETGLNWSAILSSDDVDFTIQQNMVGVLAPDDIAGAEIIYNRGAHQFSSVFKALETNDFGEVVASPHLVAIDGRPGTVQIGQDVSINKRDFAGNVTTEMIPSGIILTVTPTIVNEDTIKFVHLKVTAEKSTAIISGDNVVINKTTADTELLLLDGEEVAIGGLFSTTELRSLKGIPLLKRIPKWFFGLGYIFGYESTTITDQELIILLKIELMPSLYDRLKKRMSGGN
jgi:type IV pilus assembly protein PilQ